MCCDVMLFITSAVVTESQHHKAVTSVDYHVTCRMSTMQG